MRLIVTADIHLHPFRQCSKDGGQDRLMDGLSALTQTLRAAKELECVWVFLGDLKHVRGVWHQAALNRIRQIFKTFHDVPKLMLHGNHDGLAGGTTGLRPFEDEMTAVMEQPEILSGPFRDMLDEPIALWPWQASLDRLPDLIAEARDWKAPLFLGHLFLQNAVVGEKDTPIAKGSSLEDIGMGKKDPAFKWALVGDVHKAQVVVGSRDDAPVIYPGSPLGLNWGERETGKGFLLIDTKKGVVKHLPVYAPKFRVIEWDPRTSIDEVKEWKGDFVKLYIDKEDAGQLEKIRKVSEARWFESIIQRKATSPTVRSELHAGMSPRQIIDEYIRVRPPEFSKGVKDNTTAAMVGLKLMEGD